MQQLGVKSCILTWLPRALCAKLTLHTFACWIYNMPSRPSSIKNDLSSSKGMIIWKFSA